KEGEEPPPEIKRLYDIWEEIKVTVDPEKRKRLFQEILKANAENVYPIGAVGEVPHIVIVGNNFHNVPEKHPWTTMGRYLGPAGVEQFFVKQK
ncbi:ABC transporter substrate-binding protein, partial [Patescibacteria group bacterium]|nr:ABC transporter substrate-binding protein [Patescibacteria group bacterium]